MSRLKLAAEEVSSDLDTEDEVTPDNDIEILDDISTIGTENFNTLNDLMKSCMALESLTDICDAIEKDKVVTESQINNVRIAEESLFFDLGYKVTTLSTSLEDFKNEKISLESVIDVVTKAIKKIASLLGGYIKREVDFFQYIFTFIELQSNSIKKLSKTISASKSDKIDFNINDNKYLKYGNNMSVKDFNEYKRLYSDQTKDMVSFLNAITTFTDKDFMQSYKTLFSPITGYEEKCLEMYDNLDRFTKKTISSLRLDKKRLSTDADIYTCGNYLGLGRMEIIRPSASAVDRDQLYQKKATSLNWQAFFIRDTKFEISFLKNKKEFTAVSKKDVLDVLDNSMKLVDAYKPLKSITTKLSAFGAYAITYDFGAQLLSPLGVIRMLLLNYRFMLKSSMVIYGCTYGAFNFTRGNIANTIEMANRFNSKAK